MRFSFSKWSEYFYQVMDIDELDFSALQKISSSVIQLNNFPNITHFLIKNLNTLNDDTKVEKNKILVGFNGAMNVRNDKFIPPFFSFAQLADHLNIPLLSLSDSSLYLDENLKLSWYTGNNNYKNQQQIIASIIKKICHAYNLEPVLCGGSGGGFASLAISSYLDIEHTCFVWNPQTSIQKYHRSHVNDYVKKCYPHFTSTNLVNQFNQIGKYNIIHDVTARPMNEKMKLLYLQNIPDEFHMINHCSPYVSAHNFIEDANSEKAFIYSNGESKRIVGNCWGDGHAPPPYSLLEYILKEIFQENSSVNIIGNSISQQLEYLSRENAAI